MKMKDLRLRVVITLLLLLGLPILAAGQDQISSETFFIYGYDADSRPFFPTASDIYPIEICFLEDEFTVRKNSDVSKTELESLVTRLLPDAQFEWYSQAADVCSVISENEELDNVIDILLENDTVLFAQKMWLRKVYMDLMSLYPVSEVATYGFDGEIWFSCQSDENANMAYSLFESIGLEISYQSDNRSGYVMIQKGMDVINIANLLHESGYFLIATPNKLYRVREMTVQTVDKESLPYYYDYNSKAYLYLLPDRFMVEKDALTDKIAVETIIKNHLAEADIIWDNDSMCTVITFPDLVENAMYALSQEKSVQRLSRKYFRVGIYEETLKLGDKNPDSFGLDGKLLLSFKENISKDDKDGVIRDYNLHLVASGRSYGKYEVPDSLDVLEVCRSIFETGLVEYCEPNTTYIAKCIFFNSSSSTTGVEPIKDVTEVKTEYYNLLGRRMEEPSGLTIKVTHYSNGTIRSEKQLFEK